MDNFLPDAYEVPSSSGNYLKFDQGENRFRILSKPVIGWEDWKDKKPLRFHMDSKPEKPVDPKKPVKHFWAMVVWNYKLGRIQILEITQSSIQKAIKALAADEDWGDPLAYDIKVSRTGEGMETEYQINPAPHKPIAEEIVEQQSTVKVNLDSLFEGKDPFSDTPF
jgi:hypothetical protein